MESVSAEVPTPAPRSFGVSKTANKKEVDTARRAGWTILDYDIPESVSDRSYRVCQCEGAYGQRHYGIIKDLSVPCVICKIMLTHREKNCTQHVYVEGRRTFPFTCGRGHQYLACDYKKGLGRCPMCIIEDECKARGRTISFDSECIYVNPDSRLRYYCQSCTSDHYITYAKWTSLFNRGRNKPKPYSSVINWCQKGNHCISDPAFESILITVGVFEQLFDARFDDCDDIIAANNKFLSGIYFTGYNRKLKLAFVHTLDTFYIHDNVPLINWCTLRDITLIRIGVKPCDGYDIILSKVCSGIIAAKDSSGGRLHTRFDNLIAEDSPEDASIESRVKKMISCMLIEGRLALKNRVAVKS